MGPRYSYHRFKMKAINKIRIAERWVAVGAKIQYYSRMHETAQATHAWRWFDESRFGVFIQWGPASVYGRGEHVLLQEHMDQKAYAKAACRWNPKKYDPDLWARAAREAGFRFSVLTARATDGYCLWKTATTDYSASAQAPKRDLLKAYVKAFRDAGLRVGVSYSLADWRLPVFWQGPAADPAAWGAYCNYVREQIRELLTNYGPIDLLILTDPGPYTQTDWGVESMLALARELQPAIIISDGCGPGAFAGDMAVVGPEAAPPSQGLWASLQTPTWCHKGYVRGERWLPTDLLLDQLVATAGRGGTQMLTVGPKSSGAMPLTFILRMAAVGKWLKTHGEAIYGSDAVTDDLLSFGRVTRQGNSLYLIIRVWDRKQRLVLKGLKTRARRAVLVTTGQEVDFKQNDIILEVTGLPRVFRSLLFPVIRIECESEPEVYDWALAAGWDAKARRLATWSAARGTGVNAIG